MDISNFTSEWLSGSESKVTKAGIYNGDLNQLHSDLNQITFNLAEHNRLWVEMGKAGRDYENVNERIESLHGKNSARSVKEAIGWTTTKLERTRRHYQSFLNPDDE